MWQQAWARAVDLIENPFRQSFLLGSYPPITVYENDKEVQVIAEIPGMSSKDINLSIQDGVLSISGEKKEEKMEGEVYREAIYGYFSREVPLGKNLKWDMAKAQCFQSKS
jgi:HSP20 family protein